MPLCGGSKNVQRKLVLLYAPTTPAGRRMLAFREKPADLVTEAMVPAVKPPC